MIKRKHNTKTSNDQKETEHKNYHDQKENKTQTINDQKDTENKDCQ